MASSTLNSLSELSIKTNHLMPLDFKTVIKLPDSHVWSSTISGGDQINNNVTFDNETAVPIIDLTSPQVITLLRQACEEWGIFQVTNHGISMELLNEVELQVKRLFALPQDRKLLALKSSPESLTGYGLPRISTFFSKVMWSEGFTIAGSPYDNVNNLKQLWPQEHDHVDFCNVISEYQKEMKRLTDKMIRLMLKSLGLTPEDIEWFKPEIGSKDAQPYLQLNSYPICPDPNQAMGLAAHTDSSLLTLLHQSSATSSLQAFKENIGWVSVHPITGALVVNIGDLMHIITNGRFKSVIHRALVNNTHHRVSIAYLYGPSRDVKISPPLKLVDHDNPILYRPVTWKEYLAVKATHFDKALEVIRNDNNNNTKMLSKH